MAHDADTTVEGTVAPGFEAVGQAFAANFAERGEVGAALAIYRDGEPVVDLWGGFADQPAKMPWAEDTLVLIYSASKGAAAVVVNLLAERGDLDLDAPIASYWPEFGAAGKAAVTARMVLSHVEGLPVLEAELDLEQLFDGSSAATSLAAQTPRWEPGTAHGYHGLTFGWLVAEIVARATDRPIGDHFEDLVARPLGLDFHLGGLPVELEPRVAVQVDPDPPDLAAIEAIPDPAIRDGVLAAGGRMVDPGSDLARSLNPAGVLSTPDAAVYGTRVVHGGEQPAVNGITDARSLAKMYAACIGEVDGIRLLTEEGLSEATRERSGGSDELLVVPSRFATGFMLRSPICEMLSESSFGHVGAGGALGFADGDARVGFGYAQSKLGTGMVGDPRTEALIAALRDSL